MPVAEVATTTPDASDSEESPGEQSTPSNEVVEQASDQAASTSGAQQAQAQAQQEEPTEFFTTQQAAQEQQAQSEQQALVEQPEQSEQAPDQTQVEIEQSGAAETEPQLVATIAPDVITQGEALALTVRSDEAAAVAATIDGRSWNLAEVRPGVWWAVLAVPRDAEIGSRQVVVDLYGQAGVWLRSLAESVVVLASTAPLEEIVLGGAGAVLDPVEVQRDVNVRFVEHTAVTGPPRWDAPWILPVEGEVSGVFGAKRSYDGVLGDEWHHGHDIAAHHGDPIVAPAPGTVVWTGDLVLHGMGVIIDHGAGVYSGYWHMSLIVLREGMEVAPGDWLGNIGTTGLSTGPHLHWEVIVQGIDVDPIQWTGDAQPPIPSPSGAG